jgi:hypothetical protein
MVTNPTQYRYCLKTNFCRFGLFPYTVFIDRRDHSGKPLPEIWRLHPRCMLLTTIHGCHPGEMFISRSAAPIITEYHQYTLGHRAGCPFKVGAGLGHRGPSKGTATWDSTLLRRLPTLLHTVLALALAEPLHIF